MAGRADISIVIPTRDRWPALRRTLTALGKQHLDGVVAEIVVVDNGSQDGSRESAAAAIEAGEFGLDVILCDELVRGPAAARNTGIRAAHGELVLFLGDDTRPSSREFVILHLRSHAEGAGPSAVVGRVIWDPEVRVSPVMDWLERTGRVFDYARASREPPGPYLFYTSNVSLARGALLDVDGFDERFPAAAWEDYEIAMRLQDAGTHIVYRPDLVVHHDHPYDLRASLRRMESVGRHGNLLNRIHRLEHPAPEPTGVQGWIARWLAPAAMRIEPPHRIRPSLRDRWFRVAHLAALARGTGGEPLATDAELRGGVRRPAPTVERPAISVVTPFHGDESRARELLARLNTIEVRPGDELIVADNTEAGTVEGIAPASGVTVLAARSEHSPAHARNAGADRARGEWMLFVDSDCRPSRDLLDAYFAEPVADDVGALAGRVIDTGDGRTLLGRYAISRRRLDQATYLRHGHAPFAATANLLVRRSAWEEVGGLAEGAMSGEDSDLCWRLQRVGWRLEYRPHAVVEHENRSDLRALLRQQAGYSGGRAWLERRHPGSQPPPRHAGRIVRCAARALQWTVEGRFERAALRMIDIAVMVADTIGYERENRPRGLQRGSAPPAAEAMVLVQNGVDVTRRATAEALQAFTRAAGGVRIEAAARCVRLDRGWADRLPILYWEDDGFARRRRDALWLCVRHPLRCLADRRWRVASPSTAALAPCVRRCHREGTRRVVVPAGDPMRGVAERVIRLAGIDRAVEELRAG